MAFIQQWFRYRRIRRRKAAVKIQANVRGWLARRLLKGKRVADDMRLFRAIVFIQVGVVLGLNPTLNPRLNIMFNSCFDCSCFQPFQISNPKHDKTHPSFTIQVMQYQLAPHPTFRRTGEGHTGDGALQLLGPSRGHGGVGS